jgi:putative membrane protein
MMRGHHAWMGSDWGLFTLVIIVATVVVTLGLAMLARRRIGADAPRQTARQILDERYARGELTSDEYQHHSDSLRAP